MFREAHRSLSGAPNCICSLWFIYPCGDRPLFSLYNGPSPHGYINQRLQIVWSSWWWTECRSKYVVPLINFGIINSITRLHLVGCFYWTIAVCRICFHRVVFVIFNKGVKHLIYEYLTLRVLMSYIYGVHILDVSRSHTTAQQSR
jgi:hypothetical protein